MMPFPGLQACLFDRPVDIRAFGDGSCTWHISCSGYGKSNTFSRSHEMKPGQSETFKILCIVICLVSFSCAGAVWSQPADPMKTGLPAITEDELRWQDDHMKRVRKVRLNRFAMKRVNRWRLKHKQARLRTNHFVPELGKDLEVTTGSAAIGAASLAEGASELPAAEMPGSVDNSQLKYFPPIRSQGGLNSCGAFSGVYYTMTYMHALANDLDAKNGGDAFRLSPKWPYNMLNGGKNSGIWYYWAYEIASAMGMQPGRNSHMIRTTAPGAGRRKHGRMRYTGGLINPDMWPTHTPTAASPR